MLTLREAVREAAAKNVAVGHFNISDLAGLKAIFEAATELKVPVIIGTSEGEREFIGPKQAVALVRSLREEYDYPIFINADHTHSFEKVQEAAAAGYDSIIVDFAKLSLEENIRETKKAVDYVRSVDPNIIVEGELGYIGTSSEVMKDLPEGAAIDPADFTSVEDAVRFVKETGVDFFAPAVGNIHGMFENASKPRLDAKRVADIKEAVGVPLVLHGGSGDLDEDFVAAIKAGISIVHINTEIRRAWKSGMEEGMKLPTVAPYKVLAPAMQAVKVIVKKRLGLFSGKV
jgi:fructose-bisphosphate aldolase class II